MYVPICALATNSLINNNNKSKGEGGGLATGVGNKCELSSLEIQFCPRFVLFHRAHSSSS